MTDVAQITRRPSTAGPLSQIAHALDLCSTSGSFQLRRDWLSRHSHHRLAIACNPRPLVRPYHARADVEILHHQRKQHASWRFAHGLFVLTRTLNTGNLTKSCPRMPEQRVSPEKNQYLASFRSFLYVSKYPPSFAFLGFTISINLFLLGFVGALLDKVARRIPTLITFGQSALFFYVAHIWLFAGLRSLAKT